jgi:ASC-1-like (ASCH) protein
MKLQPHPFDKIKKGSKTIEVRLFDEKRREIKLGDTIEFRREPEQTEIVQAKVIGLLNYKTFSDLANDFPNIDGDGKEALLERIYTFYTKEQEEKYSVLGIKVRIDIPS